VPGVVVEQAQRDLVKRGLYRGDLCHHVDAVPVLLNHPLYAANLALETAEPV
jgi:protein-S-isoprenylcysteine O-methyltransferase Ste14